MPKWKMPEPKKIENKTSEVSCDMPSLEQERERRESLWKEYSSEFNDRESGYYDRESWDWYSL
jgi:hypothetical protein